MIELPRQNLNPVKTEIKKKVVKESYLDAMIKERILEVFAESRNQINTTASKLGISRQRLYRYLFKYGITHTDVNKTQRNCRAKK